MDVRTYNRSAWDKAAELAGAASLGVSAADVERARRGGPPLKLTPGKTVPPAWLPPLPGCRVLCLAGGGGEQGPLFAAAGALVTVLDNSPRQLAADRAVAARERLELTTVEGDMADLGAFADASFDLVFHPLANCFTPDVRPVWREAARVLRPGGTLLASFLNPVLYLFDEASWTTGVFRLKYAAPYSDLASLADAERERYTNYGKPLEFGHSLTDQLGGQADAGLALTGLYEDGRGDDPLDRHVPAFLATRALRYRAAEGAAQAGAPF